MGKSTQYRNWAVTWDADNSATRLDETTTNGHRLDFGGYTFDIYVGPQEDPDNDNSGNHNHVLVHCQEAAVTKTKVRQVLEAYSKYNSQTVREQITYIRRLESTKEAYMRYCYKSIEDSFMSKDDKIVKNCVEDIKSIGMIPTGRSVKRKLIDSHGANAYNKRFCKIIDTYLMETDIVDERGNPAIDIDVTSNCKNFIYSLLVHRMNLKKAYIRTTYKPLNNCSILFEWTFLLSIIPYFSKRLMGASDGLPSMYLYGKSGAGKSNLYTNCRYIRKVPTDAQGVSRYKMDHYQTALLCDDVPSDFINDKVNSSTLKNLCLGENAIVKIMGNTIDIKAFVIVTSNEEPAYMKDIVDDTDKDSIITNASWKRRFLTCQYKEICPFDGVTVNYDDLKLRSMAAIFFKKYFDLLYVDEKNRDYLSMLDTYYDICLKDYFGCSDDVELFDECRKLAHTQIVNKKEELKTLFNEPVQYMLDDFANADDFLEPYDYLYVKDGNIGNLIISEPRTVSERMLDRDTSDGVLVSDISD